MSVTIDRSHDLIASAAAAPDADTILSVENLTVGLSRYSEASHKALRDVDFTIRRGEMVGLVGESGAGKTTLSRAIIGHVPRPGLIEAGRVMFGPGVSAGWRRSLARRSCWPATKADTSLASA